MVVEPSTSTTLVTCCPVATALKNRGDWPSAYRVTKRSWIVALPAPPPPPTFELPLFEAPQDHATTGDEAKGAGIVSVPIEGRGGAAKAFVVAIKAMTKDVATTCLMRSMATPLL